MIRSRHSRLSERPNLFLSGGFRLWSFFTIVILLGETPKKMSVLGNVLDPLGSKIDPLGQKSQRAVEDNTQVS